MSRIGIQPIAVPDGVTVTVEDGVVTVKGGKGESSQTFPAYLAVKCENGQVEVSRTRETKEVRAMHGTIRSLVANLVEGVSKGFERELEIEGVGYRAAVQGTTLVLNVGYSHAIEYPIPEGITIETPDATKVKVSGISKQLVGLVSSRIRAFAPAEPYKGKGIKYKGEHIRRKVGKAVA